MWFSFRYVFAFLFFIAGFTSVAQTDSVPVFKDATKAGRAKTYNNIVKNIITKNLSLPLTDSTEENWQDAFYAMEVLQYKQPWVNEKIKTAFDSVEKRSISFQRALLELVYSQKNEHYQEPCFTLLQHTGNNKIFAMCAEYLLMCNASPALIKETARLSLIKLNDEKDVKNWGILYSLVYRVEKKWSNNNDVPAIALQFDKNYLKGNTVVYSIQRKNRNYPGIAMVRDTAGNFVTGGYGNIFSIPQLARSITNLPGYLTNGNTPQGIFRMNGFAVSSTNAIGPTENIQLLMPYETNPQFFLKDSTISDTAWTPELYERLLPGTLKKYQPLFESFFASAIGRTEIIAHGTTVDPGYYKGQTYYPHTPTQGCLCTKEIWSEVDGRRVESDQQKLVNAVKKAGGANGYVIVIEIDDQQKPVSIDEIMPYLKAAKK